jgi:hypothetical protein
VLTVGDDTTFGTAVVAGNLGADHITAHIGNSDSVSVDDTGNLTIVDLTTEDTLVIDGSGTGTSELSSRDECQGRWRRCAHVPQERRHDHIGRDR